MTATPDVIFRYPDPLKQTSVDTIIERRSATGTVSRWRVIRVSFYGDTATAEVEEVKS